LEDCSVGSTITIIAPPISIVLHLSQPTFHHTLLRQFEQGLHVGSQRVAGVERERSERFAFARRLGEFAHTRQAQSEIVGEMFRLDKFGVNGARGRQVGGGITITIQGEE
jgi:hypothetical protein